MSKTLASRHPITNFAKTRQTLLTEKLLDQSRKYVIQDVQVLFPLKTTPNDHQRKLIKRRNGELLKVRTDLFPEKKGQTLSLKELDTIHSVPLPKSVIQAGNIILLNELPDEGKNHKNKIGQILKENFNVRAVFLKEKVVKGKERVATWSRLAGKGDPIAIYRESGFYYFVNFSKVFFNPRMQKERIRVVSKVKPNETVIDMFTGIGPFAIPIGEKGAKVYAIDINPTAIRFLKMNKGLNNIDEQVIPIVGDAKHEVQKLQNTADRIIMNYPANSFSFLEKALIGLKEEGRIHFYCFSWGEDENTALKKTKQKLRERIPEAYRVNILDKRIILNAAPAKHLVEVDLKLESSNF